MLPGGALSPSACPRRLRFEDKPKDSGIYDVESVDARVKLENWEPVKLLAPECGELSDRLSLPAKIMEEVRPIAVIDTKAGHGPKHGRLCLV
jgi:hypothetical protein